MTNKLLIGTRTGGKLKKMEQITLAFKRYPEGATPKTLALAAGLNVNTVKNLLPVMSNVQKKDGLPGYYISVDETTQGSVFDWNFHNLILTCSLPGYAGERVVETLSCGLVNFELTIGAESKLATLRIHTDHPMNVSSLCGCLALFVELVEKHSGTRPDQNTISVSSIEFNKDYLNLRLDGASCIAVEHLLEQWKLYQKKHSLRLELKLKVPFNAKTLTDMLTNSALSIDVYHQLAIIKKNQDEVKSICNTTRSLTQSLLEKVSPVGRKL